MRSLRVVPPGELSAADDGSPGTDPGPPVTDTGPPNNDPGPPVTDPGSPVTTTSSSESDPTTGDGSASSADVIVVEAEDGERFQLTLDDAVREALREAVGPGEPAEPETAPPVSSSASARATKANAHPLTPREIQTRVRAGESAQDLADDSGTSMDKIMRFAYAVLEERSRVADEARRGRARRDGDGNLVPFGETVDGRFAAASIEPQSVEWDSFRRPDGSWVVSAAWTSDGTERHAHWAFSLTARTVLPLDQVSSDLLSDRPLRPVVRVVPDEDATAAAELYDQEAPDAGGYTAPTPPTNWLRGAGTSVAALAETGSSARKASDNPPLPLRLADPLPASSGGVDPIESTRNTEDDMDGEGVEGIDVGDDTKLDELFDDDFVDNDKPAESTPPAVAPAAPAASSGSRRNARAQTKVPRWDDILLSTRRKND